MANPEWPATLPQYFQRTGFGAGRRDNALRPQPEVGPAKTRPRSTLAVRQWSGTLRMTAAQVAAFEAFYETTLVSGSLPFDWADPVDGSTKSFAFSKPPDGPKPYKNGVHWDYAIALEEVP